MDRRFTIAAIILLLLSLAIRLPWLIEYADRCNLDEANIGVMAIDILRGKIPVFMYGHNYFGPLEAFFIAGSILVLPHDALTLRLAMMVIWLLSALFLWRGARLLLAEKSALVALAFYALPPTVLVVWSILPSGGHMAGLLTGTLIFYLSAIIVRTKNISIRFFLFYGIVIGFSLWNHPGNLLILASAALFVFVDKPRLLLTKAIPLTLIGISAGGFPFWRSIYESLDTLALGQSQGSGHTLDGFIVGLTSTAKSVWRLIGYDLAPSPVSFFLGGLLALAMGVTFFYTIKNIRNHDRSTLIPIFAWSLIVATIAAYTFVDGDKYGYPQYRYLLPIIPALALLLGHSFDTMYNKRRTLAIIIVTTLITANCAITLTAYATGAYNDYRMDTRLDDRFFTYQEILPFLKSHGITRTYVRFLDDTIITYLTNGKIIAAAHSGSRMKEYSLRVDGAENPAMVIEATDEANFDAAISASGATYSKKRGDYNDFYFDIKPPPHRYIPIDRTKIVATGNPKGESAHYALDGDFSTLYNSEQAQIGSEQITLDFGTPRSLARVDLVPTYLSDMPGHIIIETSLDGETWAKQADVPNIGPLFWSGPHLFFRADDGFNQYLFEPKPVRYLRVRQVGQTNRHWHLREIFLYERAPLQEQPAPDWERVLAFLDGENITHLLGDYYFTANVELNRSGRIWSNQRENRRNQDFARSRKDFRLDEIGAVAIHDRERALTENFLRSQGYKWRSARFGVYQILYELTPPSADAPQPRYQNIRWTGSHMIGGTVTPN